MFHASKDNFITSGHKPIDAAYHNAEWLITAFASTLVFIIFVMQVYRIPTGSMAETLRGAHFRVRCGQCGYRYDHDFISERYINPKTGRPTLNTANPAKKMPIAPRSSRCASCGYSEPKPIRSHDGQYFVHKDGQTERAYSRTIFKGDQIFVLKSVYQFFEPKRWDVIVFKNPTEPRINYIKRCVALPGETLQIIDGDIFIDGNIQRKPGKVQEELWMTVYDNDYQPARPDDASFNGHSWKQPFEKVETSKWNLSGNNSTVFELHSNDSSVQRIQYNDQQGNDFRATYAYDDPASYPMMPVCSDLMVQYYPEMQADSAAGVQISKYGIAYQGWIKSDGTLQMFRLTPSGQQVLLEETDCLPSDLDKTSRFRFAVVDQQLVLEFGSSKLIGDLGTGIDAAGTDRQITPQVQILGMGKLRLSHIGLYRDIYYLSSDEDNRVQRASRNHPMVLEKDEFFACGDNSPFSADSRLWTKPGLGNNDRTYPAGVVPKDYLVGKAFFVHWPGGYRGKD
ncbi:MAG: signal peptidase I [Planctomycetota bacterium]|jgi:signal peptidase I